jgi:hypothetical protein
VAVEVRLESTTQPAEAISVPATVEAATNKLLHAAKFDLPTPGRWQAEVAIDGSSGNIRVPFEVEVGPRVPRWAEFGFWLALPILAILLFSVHQVLVRRRGRPAWSANR